MLSGKGRAGLKAMECGYSLTACLRPPLTKSKSFPDAAWGAAGVPGGVSRRRMAGAPLRRWHVPQHAFDVTPAAGERWLSTLRTGDALTHGGQPIVAQPSTERTIVWSGGPLPGTHARISRGVCSQNFAARKLRCDAQHDLARMRAHTDRSIP